VEGKEKAMARLSSSRSAMYKISQIVKAKQIARRWHKLTAVPTTITGIKHALSMGFSYHYVQDEENEINRDSESTSLAGHPWRCVGRPPLRRSEGGGAVRALCYFQFFYTSIFNFFIFIFD